MLKKADRNKLRKKRHYRIRNHVFGSSERPRLNVYRSNKHIYAQIIDDVKGNTLVAVSTLTPEIANAVDNGKNVDAARMVGKMIGERAVANGIDKVVFDRGGYKYHGRVAALASAAREAGLEF
jgi:large subunit ribosomal protein L18